MNESDSPQTDSNVAAPQVNPVALQGRRMGISRFDTKKIDLEKLSSEELFNLACFVLRKPYDERTEKDTQLLQKCTSNIKFFQDLVEERGPDIHMQCCQRLEYHFCKAGEIVFNLGETGNTFYITLQGSVGVWVSLPKAGNDPLGLVEFVLTEVKVLPAGAAFGELALMSNKPRAATIIAKEDTHFATLEKGPFVKILKEAQERKLRQQLEFFANMKLFDGWNHNLLHKMFLQCTLMVIHRNQALYREKDEAKEIYFIKSGEFKISKVIKMPEESNNGFKALNRNELFKFNNKAHCRNIELAILSEGEILGEEDIVLDQDRQTTVHCVSEQAVVYVLSKKEFLRRVYSEPISRYFLKYHIKWKNELYLKRIDEIFQINIKNKELLMQVAHEGSFKVPQLLNSSSIFDQQNEASPRSPKRADRISTLSPRNSKEPENILPVFQSLGGITISKSQVNLTTEKSKENMEKSHSDKSMNKPIRPFVEYQPLAVKRVRPRHYSEFVPVDESIRARIINFGVPRSLMKTNPMTLSMKKDPRRGQRELRVKMLYQAMAQSGDKSLKLSQFNDERQSLLSLDSFLEHPQRGRSLDVQSQRLFADDNHEYRSPDTSKNDLSFSRYNQVSTEHQFKEAAKKHLANRKISQFMENGHSKSLSKLPTEPSLEKDSINSEFKKEKLGMHSDNTSSFGGFQAYMENRIKQNHQSNNTHQQAGNFKKSQINPMNQENGHNFGKSSEYALSNQHLQQKPILSSVAKRLIDDTPSVLDISEQNLLKYRTNDKISQSQVSLHSDRFPIADALKPKFYSHSLKVREFKTEIAHVKSLLKSKRGDFEHNI